MKAVNELIVFRSYIIPVNKSSNNKKPDQSEEWSKRRCLCCNKIFDSWGIGNRLCKRCK